MTPATASRPLYGFVALNTRKSVMKTKKIAHSESVPALEDPASFKFWRIQNPNAYELLKEIIFRWRSASARAPGQSWRYVVYPRERWSEWAQLSRGQLDRNLKILVSVKLIVREQHRFAG